MIILGINAYHPDSSACLLIDGEIKIAIEEERINRIKHWSGLPILAIKHCLQDQKISIGDIDIISINQNFFANFFKRIKFILLNNFNFDFYFNKLQSKIKKKNILDIISIEIGALKKSCKLIEVEHHKSHAASAFYESPFDKCANVSIDGFGDFSSVSWGISANNKINIDHRIVFPHSLGIFYESFTQFLGFKNFGDEYKMMGLSCYGKSSEISKVNQIIQLKKNGAFELDLSYFRHHKSNIAYKWNNATPTTGILFSEKINKLFGLPKKLEENVSDYHKNIAASVQNIYEKTLFHILNYVYEKYKIENLTISGGCAQNSLANGKILNNTKFSSLFVPSNPGDAGGAVGSAYIAWNKSNKGRVIKKFSAYLGPSYSNLEIENLIINNTKKLTFEKCNYFLENNDNILCAYIAKKIETGKIIGWFQGRMEWGPRALGNRSILADPRNSKIRDIINIKIKRRETFRPFAPSILLDKANEWFENFTDEEPFMSRVLQFKKEKINLVPAVVHVDGTGRLQTVKEENNPRYYKLIKEFYNLTNVPIILNTSFNENEPIVFKPEHALECFLRTNMDFLVMENWVIHRNN
jgi:carbamoyltransferase